MEAKRASLSRRDCSDCLRSVMSWTMPESVSGLPAPSRFSSPASAQTKRTLPSGRRMRYSRGVGVPSSATARLTAFTAARSSGWMAWAMTSARSPVKVSRAMPKSRYISSDHSSRLDLMCQVQLPTLAKRWALLRAASERRRSFSSSLLRVMSRSEPKRRTALPSGPASVCPRARQVFVSPSGRRTRSSSSKGVPSCTATSVRCLSWAMSSGW